VIVGPIGASVLLRLGAHRNEYDRHTSHYGKVAGMSTKPVQDTPAGVTSAASDPSAEREARRKARDDRRGPRTERPEVMIPSRRKRLPLEAPLMRTVASAGIVGIAVVIAAIMSSQHSAGWLIGLVTSVVSLLLAALLWSSRRL
jgi:hypothetical protein